MNDNRTTELLDGLRNVGNLHEFAELFGFDWHDDSDWTWHDVAVKMADGLEQAIAATLGSGTLTAEQVEKIVNRNCEWYEGGELDAQAIADELNTELGGGNCARCAEDLGRYADSLCDPLKERIAELLRCLENDWHIHASWDGLRKFWCIELNEEGVRMRDAELGSGMCEFIGDAKHPPKCSACGWQADTYDCDWLDGGVYEYDGKFCKQCGAKVVGE